MKNTSKAPEENTRIKEIAASINKQFGEGALMSLGSGPASEIEATSTGSLTLDRALGTGGYARGRIIEIFGPESSGKTTLSLHAISEVQARGGTAAFIDAEHAFDTKYAQALGVDLSRLLVSQPDCGEQGLDIAGKLVESGAVDLVVIDSVAALVPQAEINGEMGDQHMGLHARLMGRGVRKLTGDASRTKTSVIFINQLRMKIGVVFGNPETTTGGHALRFFASTRLDVRRVGKVTIGEKVIGNRTRVKVVKNKLASPFQEAEFDIRWGEGIDRYGELVDFGLETGVITKSGAYLSVDGKSIGQGKERARAYLIETPDLVKRILGERSKPTSPAAEPPEGGSTKKTPSKAA